MLFKKSYLILSIALVLLLCVAQIVGSTLLIVPFLAAFLALLGWACTNNFTLPILLFFLPWSPILRTSTDGFSVFTFGLVLICAISIIKKRFRFQKFSIAAGVILLFLTLVSKVIDGNSLSFDYIAFMMLFVLFPVVKQEWKEKKYDFYQIVVFFALGTVLAALCALSLAQFPNIAKFIRVDSYSTITRRSGFYGDANFYTAQITAALGSCLALVLRTQKTGRVAALAVLALALLYCGFLSASKSFVLVTAVMLAVWIVLLLRMRGRTGFKAMLLIIVTVSAVFIATSAVFGELIKVVLTRFSYSSDLNSFTTGRVELWISYMEEILGNVKIFFLGKGFTNVKVNGRASHNTILQCIFQFGFLGVPLLVYWLFSFYRDIQKSARLKKKCGLELFMIAVGVFLPWMAIDALFFDEFFLLQWYMFSAVQQLRDTDTQI